MWARAWVRACRNLSNNQLSDIGAEYVSQLLTRSQLLVSLDLCGNDIGPRGCVALGSALKANHSLTSLSLSATAGIARNHAGPRGAKVPAHSAF